jgi:hypothetical protein
MDQTLAPAWALACETPDHASMMDQAALLFL